MRSSFTGASAARSEASSRETPCPFLEEEIEVDDFAGGGGASTGMEQALGRSPAVAINHDATALAMHAVNHPQTVHLTSDIWKVDPKQATGGRPVGLLWASPDCKHFSKAKGGKPRDKNIRGLAWVVVHWANVVSPRVIILENVEEFQDWGPLGDDDQPCPVRKGETFARWVTQFERLGYAVAWRELRACDYGAPTIRKRLFLIARRDGRPIAWPEPTHGDPASEAVRAGRLQPWRSAADIIDWSIACPSIFATSAEIKADLGIRAIRPLQPATLARIAKGVRRYVLDAAHPFIIPITHTRDAERGQPAAQPLCTITSAHRGEQALVAPFVAGVGGRMAQTEARCGDQPMQTLTAKADSAVVAPYLVPRYGERQGQEPRTRPIDVPAPVVVATGNGGSLVAAHLTTMRNADKPYQGADQPAHAVTAGGAHMGVVAAFLAQNNYLEPGHDAREPVSTIVAKGSTQAAVSAGLTVLKGRERRDADVRAPAPTSTAQGCHLAGTRAFLTKYYGADQDPDLAEPLHTATTKARFGLSEVLLQAPPFGPEHHQRARAVADLLRSHGLWDGGEFVTAEIEGVVLVIVDLGLRMLTPRELFRAQGFPDSYVIDRKPDGAPISKTEQVAKCGNSVCPPIAAALVAANYTPERAARIPDMMEAAE
ncbi:DNA cytosine methyltransferase [Bradyrhizobium sp. HKCCYLR1051]|uniref:DNA cytosine methyltransferase n=1 Tax=Bradyrhizobium sp. HKCCYLR1051 TaxID=3420738 RepID=UPI003EBE576A